VLKNDIDIFL